MGGITLATILFTVPHRPAPALSQEVTNVVARRWRIMTRGKFAPREGSAIFKLLSLDIPATVIMIGLITALLLALQWGGTKVRSFVWI